MASRFPAITADRTWISMVAFAASEIVNRDVVDHPMGREGRVERPSASFASYCWAVLGYTIKVKQTAEKLECVWYLPV